MTILRAELFYLRIGAPLPLLWFPSEPEPQLGQLVWQRTCKNTKRHFFPDASPVICRSGQMCYCQAKGRTEKPKLGGRIKSIFLDPFVLLFSFQKVHPPPPPLFCIHLNFLHLYLWMFFSPAISEAIMGEEWEIGEKPSPFLGPHESCIGQEYAWNWRMHDNFPWWKKWTFWRQWL